jgi:uncharacterized protein (TIGR00369 family)
VELSRLTMEVRFDGHCFGCGPLNTEGLRLTFVSGPSGSVAKFEVPERFQSWAGMVHGGVVALMLDEAVGWAAWHAGHPGVTGRLQVSYRRPLKLGESVRVVGKVERVRRTLVYCNAFIESQVDGGRIADASATLVMAETTVEVAAQ